MSPSPSALTVQLIYTRSGLLLSRAAETSEAALQSRYPDYQTALGPWPLAVLMDHLSTEHPELWPAAQQQVHDFLQGTAESLWLMGRSGSP